MPASPRRKAAVAAGRRPNARRRKRGRRLSQEQAIGSGRAGRSGRTGRAGRRRAGAGTRQAGGRPRRSRPRPRQRSPRPTSSRAPRRGGVAQPVDKSDDRRRAVALDDPPMEQPTVLPYDQQPRRTTTSDRKCRPCGDFRARPGTRGAEPERQRPASAMSPPGRPHRKQKRKGDERNPSAASPETKEASYARTAVRAGSKAGVNNAAARRTPRPDAGRRRVPNGPSARCWPGGRARLRGGGDDEDQRTVLSSCHERPAG